MLNIKSIAPLLALSLSACSSSPGDNKVFEPKVTRYVMHSPYSTPQKQDCFDVTETIRVISLVESDGQVVQLPQITNHYFPTACTADAKAYEPLRDSILDPVRPDQAALPK